jgi:hypothetical protein
MIRGGALSAPDDLRDNRPIDIDATIDRVLWFVAGIWLRARDARPYGTGVWVYTLAASRPASRWAWVRSIPPLSIT